MSYTTELLPKYCIGEKVKCIKNEGKESELTLNKEYEITQSSTFEIAVINNKGYHNISYPVSYFKYK